MIQPIKSYAALKLMFVAVTILVVCRIAFLYFSPILLLNITPSMPKGFYYVSIREELKKGDFVAFRLPQEVRESLGARSWLHPRYPFIKTIGAVSRDFICRNSNQFSINEKQIFSVSKKDQQGQDLPVWSGCQTIKENYFVPIGQNAKSFDARYFGEISNKHIICLLYTSDAADE